MALLAKCCVKEKSLKRQKDKRQRVLYLPVLRESKATKRDQTQEANPTPLLEPFPISHQSFSSYCDQGCMRSVARAPTGNVSTGEGRNGTRV